MSGTTHRRLRLAATLGAAAVLALTGCSGTGSASGDGQAGFITGKGGVDTAAAGHRQDAPDISGTGLDGSGKVGLADFKGKVVVLNIWGSWCSPCRAEAKGLQEVAQKYADQGVQFLGINTRDTDPANAISFEKNFGITYPSIYDPDGTQILKFPKGSLNPQSIPTTIVVDRQGRLAARAMRALSSDDLEAMLRPVVAEQGQQ
ncbi:TlpA disulfide reductase family protein [Kitasatospora paracochleata]|uniref:Thiol-disulfide isomerase/thioredoxin n=1 Tax=Kitasatospora paracochleata TaxID=58354 RepID=A0ABT1IX04_9ACTN|nr:TlpA disulfide reductase family protein [Kitasatospora paracochleata]MCP2309680.1 thiol-disulfide isomerase/thioredoxin [Kitasatospora paracochleata]